MNTCYVRIMADMSRSVEANEHGVSILTSALNFITNYHHHKLLKCCSLQPFDTYEIIKKLLFLGLISP